MKLLNTKALAAAICAGVLSIGAASAATQNPGIYETEPVSTGGNLHELWLPGMFDGAENYWQFLDGSTLTVTETGATLDAVAQRNGAEGDDWLVSVQLELTETVEGGSIKCAWTAVCDTTDWDFFDYVSGTITGLSHNLAGLVLDMFQTGPAAQLGTGANDKDGRFGFSSWFTLAVSHDNQYEGRIGLPHHGDINLGLTPVPLPAAGWMLIAGLGGMAALRRRKTA